MKEFSYQLYSSRNYGPIDQTLAMISNIGYTQVEGYGALFTSSEDAQKLAAKLDANSLRMPTAHFGLTMLEENPNECQAIAKALNLAAIYVPYLSSEERPEGVDGWTKMGARAQEALKPVADMGIVAGWHNHDFELAVLENGETVLDALMSGGPDLQVELDLAWVAVAGANPIGLIERFSDRLSSVHIKDIAPKGECENEDGWADVGYGTMDWTAIKEAVDKSSNDYLIIEHDNPSDDQRFASRSFQHANSIWNA